MARKKAEKKTSEKEEAQKKLEIKYEQLHLFAAFRDIWQAPVL